MVRKNRPDDLLPSSTKERYKGFCWYCDNYETDGCKLCEQPKGKGIPTRWERP